MKGLPDHMYRYLRARYTERNIDEAISSVVKLAFVPILSQIGMGADDVARLKYSRSELQSIVSQYIRALQTKADALKKTNDRQKDLLKSIQEEFFLNG